MKIKKQEKNTGEKKRRRWAHKLIFHIRIVMRNRNEIEAPKKKIRF